MLIVFSHSIRFYCLAASHLTVMPKCLKWFIFPSRYIQHFGLLDVCESFLTFVFGSQFHRSFSNILISSRFVIIKILIIYNLYKSIIYCPLPSGQ